jgi:hypothetical protein
MTNLTTHASTPRQIAPGIWWLPLCIVTNLIDSIVHVHNAQYLIVGSEKTLLYDTGMPAQWPEIANCLDELLGGRDLDYIVPSHTEVNHSGGVVPLLERYPRARVVGGLQDCHLLWPEYAHRMTRTPAGTELDLGSHRFRFLEAVIKDLPDTQWGYEPSQEVMFTADGFAVSHRPPLEDDDRPTHSPGECDLVVTELPKVPEADQIVWITRAALYWTRFIRLDPFRRQFEALMDEYPTRIVAPAHGAVIDDMAILPRVWTALELSYSPDAAGVDASADRAFR